MPRAPDGIVVRREHPTIDEMRDAMSNALDAARSGCAQRFLRGERSRLSV